MSRHTKITYTTCIYMNGPKFANGADVIVIRRIVTEDFAYAATEAEARTIIAMLEKADKKSGDGNE